MEYGIQETNVFCHSLLILLILLVDGTGGKAIIAINYRAERGGDTQYHQQARVSAGALVFDV
jgi:hypothetical protein